MITRLLSEFGLNFEFFKDIILNIPIHNNITQITNLQDCFKIQFNNRNWHIQPFYCKNRMH